MTSYPATGLPAPRIDDAVKQYMRATMSLDSIGTEYSWACDWDPGQRMITGARLMARGSAITSLVIHRDLQEGQLHVHSHPATHDVSPSEPDLRVAQDLRCAGGRLGYCQPRL